MKKYIGSVIAVAWAAFMAVGCSTQSKTETKETRRQETTHVKNQLEAKDFTVKVDRAMPMSGRNVNLTSDYSLKIKGDSVYSYLPYFGRAYSLPYGGGEGLVFDNVMQNYTFSYGKKDVANLTFDIRTKEDTYKFIVEVFPNGSSSILVQSNNKQSITFWGSVSPGKKK